MHFLADWFELDVSRHFILSVVVTGNGSPNLIQVVPRGESLAEDETYFHLLDRSLAKGGPPSFGNKKRSFSRTSSSGAGKKPENGGRVTLRQTKTPR